MSPAPQFGKCFPSPVMHRPLRLYWVHPLQQFFTIMLRCYDQYYRLLSCFKCHRCLNLGNDLHRPLQAIVSAATTTILHYHALLLRPIIPQVAFLTMLCFHSVWSICGTPKTVCYKMVHHFYFHVFTSYFYFHVWWFSVM